MPNAEPRNTGSGCNAWVCKDLPIGIILILISDSTMILQLYEKLFIKRIKWLRKEHINCIVIVVGDIACFAGICYTGFEKWTLKLATDTNILLFL